MTARKNKTVATVTTTDSLTLAQRCAAVAPDAVDAMIARIEAAFAARDIFEAANGIKLDADSSYTRERDRMLSRGKVHQNSKNLEYCARLFVACGIAPDNDETGINRTINSGSRFNAKALKKVVEIARMVNIGDKCLEQVTISFIACSYAYIRKTGDSVIPNEFSRAFLSSVDLSKLFGDKDVAEAVSKYQAKQMTGGKETQSSQSRNVAQFLGFGEIERRASVKRGQTSIDMQHEILTTFADLYQMN